MSDDADLSSLLAERDAAWVMLFGYMMGKDVEVPEEFLETFRLELDRLAADGECSRWWSQSGFHQLGIVFIFDSDPMTWRAKLRVRRSGDDLEVDFPFTYGETRNLRSGDARAVASTILDVVAQRRRLASVPSGAFNG
jgi:hypothetical protein